MVFDAHLCSAGAQRTGAGATAGAGVVVAAFEAYEVLEVAVVDVVLRVGGAPPLCVAPARVPGGRQGMGGCAGAELTLRCATCPP